MDFFNKLGKKANEAYKATKEKASDISEEIKLKSKVNSLEDSIQELYSEIGKIVYEELRAGKDVSKDEVTSKCEEISRKKDEIEKLKTEILAVKKIKKCINCGEELDLSADFCSKCGKEQPKIEKVEIKEEPTETKEAEVIEVTDATENSVEKEENKEENN